MTNPSGLAPQAVRDTKCLPCSPAMKLRFPFFRFFLCKIFSFWLRYQDTATNSHQQRTIGRVNTIIHQHSMLNQLHQWQPAPPHRLRYVSTPWPRWECSDVERVGMKWWQFGPYGSHQKWHITSWRKDLMFDDFERFDMFWWCGEPR